MELLTPLFCSPWGLRFTAHHAHVSITSLQCLLSVHSHVVCNGWQPSATLGALSFAKEGACVYDPSLSQHKLGMQRLPSTHRT